MHNIPVLKWTVVISVILMFVEHVSSRVRISRPTLDADDLYLPNPREPLTSNSTYVRNAPIDDLIDVSVYDGVSGYYAIYYGSYLPYAKQTNETRQKAFNLDVPVCLNYEVDHENFYMGIFTCPLPFEPKEFTACCGVEYVEFCCLTRDKLSDNESMKRYGIISFVLIVLLVIIGGLVFFLLVSRGCCRTLPCRKPTVLAQ